MRAAGRQLSYSSRMPEAVEVQSMFGRIAGRYDLLNRVLSMGIDQGWRRRLLARAGDVSGLRVLDACCGTGDLSLAFRRANARVLGVDFTHEMLEHATPKAKGRGGGHDAGVLFAQGDALRLPARDASMDVCCVAFGIRNVADRRLALREMRRVLR
ncbi:MAG: demethylmenaquinone methyltransferase/2-methoxy-6-polyprenyl-1,4-benzoquinol methylase, partial [Planctomycetota bacterium]